MSALRKRKREELEADDYSGGIESEINQSSSSSKKHTLESDDEEDAETYNKKKYDVLKDDDIEGQEEGTEEFDGETRITPFNMNDEMEEGYFDGRGMYHWNKKDKDEVKDSWLDSVDWVKIKPTDNKKGTAPKEDSDDEQDKTDSISLYKECLNFLIPGESLLKAIKRLGGGKQLTASEKLKLKKFAKKHADQGTSQKVTKVPDPPSNLDKLTEVINKIMFSTGNMDIYEETYESINVKIKAAESVKPPCDKEEDIFQ